MPQRDGAGNAGMMQTADATVQPSPISAEELQRVAELGDGSVTEADIFPFRMVASGDGLDFYFTRQHDTSLKNFVRDLKAGQSVLGSHDIGTFSYGSSYDAQLVDADPTASSYEAAFYRQFDRPELRTTKLVVGNYYLVRGVTLNGQPTDDLIKAMQKGAVRKASVSFTVGQYQCGIDNKNMLAGWFGPEPGEDECSHFPGVDYKKEGVGWAWMKDNTLMETSLVYKNASPSALLVRKADELARRGLLDRQQIPALELRLDHRLPSFERSVYGGVEVPMGDQRAGQPAEGTQAAPPEHEARLVKLTQLEARDAEIEKIIGGPISVEGIRTLHQKSVQGEALFDDLVEQARSARQRALGDTSDGDRYVRMIKGTDVETVRSEITLYDEQAKRVFTPGRQVDPEADVERPSATEDDEEDGRPATVTREPILPNRQKQRS